MSDRAWVTLATNDSYALGALVLARSLRRVNAAGKLVVMVTPGVTASMRETLSTEFDEVTGVNVLDSQDSANLALLTRPELGITFTKLHCWMLTQFSKCVFLDADTLVLQNCDELFDRDEFSAAPDVGWPDCFNSGVFVFTPSVETYNRLLAFAVSSGSFDGGDQGLLNLYFNDWSVSDISRHLPFIYNMVASATYSYLPAFKLFGGSVKIVHFIGSEKPWLMYFDSATRTVRAPSGQEHLQELLQSWWDIFRADVHRKLSPEMAGDGNLSATMVEQVQDTFSHIFISSDPSSASSNSPFSSNEPYQPPPIPNFEPYRSASSQHTESMPEFHWISVAIERQAPENLYRPSPNHSSSESRSSPLNPSDHHHQHSPPTSHEDTGQVVHTETEPDCSANDQSPPEKSEDNNSEPEPSSAGLAGAFAKMALEGEKSPDQIGFEEQMRKHAWEQGHIDYLGKDSFDNIMKKLQASMAQTSTADAEAPKAKAKSPSPPKTEVAQPESQPQVPPQAEASQPPVQAPTQAASVPVAQQAPVSAETPSAPVAEAAPKQDEESQLTAERQALEKKLSEQKRIAEQRLQEEKQAAEARAAAEVAAQTAAVPSESQPSAVPVTTLPATPVVAAPVTTLPATPVVAAPVATAPVAAPVEASQAAAPVAAPVSEPVIASSIGPSESAATPSAAPAPSTPADAPPTATIVPQATSESQPSSAPEVPVAPPRRHSKVQEANTGGGAERGLRRNVGVRLGVGLSCLAVVAFAIYSASASTITSSVEEALKSVDNEHDKNDNHANDLFNSQ